MLLPVFAKATIPLSVEGRGRTLINVSMQRHGNTDVDWEIVGRCKKQFEKENPADTFFIWENKKSLESEKNSLAEVAVIVRKTHHCQGNGHE